MCWDKDYWNSFPAMTRPLSVKDNPGFLISQFCVLPTLHSKAGSVLLGSLIKGSARYKSRQKEEG